MPEQPYGYYSAASANLGPWQNVYADPVMAQNMANIIGGQMIPRGDGANYDVYYPAPKQQAAPVLYTPSFPAQTPPRTTTVAPIAPAPLPPTAPVPTAPPQFTPNYSAQPSQTAQKGPLPPGVLLNVVDGFSYNTMLFPYLADRYFPMALGQMDILRRAANYRARWFVIPDDIDQPLQPFDTLYFQINVAGGSYLWGYQFSSISATDPDDAPVATTAADVCVQAVDSCTGIPLFMDFANGAGEHSDFSSRCVPILLTQPRLILEPGLVNVQLSNRTKNTITCQLLMHFAEPCKVITEEDRQKEYSLQRRVRA